MYKSPIEIMQTGMQVKMENDIMKAVQDIGISVDKAELLKALAYDREQYQKGFADGREAGYEWISVEGRLPDRHGQQCVGLYSIGEYKGYLTPYVFTWNAYGNNGYVDGPHFSDEGLDGLKVHYWIPLPEPPEEG